MDAEYFKKTFNFTRSGNAKPLYIQLAEYIRHHIKMGVFKPGDQIVTESEICEILGVSRTTVRLSMNKLVDEGLLIRYRGKGSFIAEQKLKRRIGEMYDFTTNIRDIGATPSSIVLENEVIKADEKIAEKLSLIGGNVDVFALRRLRCADGEPLVLETSYIPFYLCSGIELINFEKASLYQVLSNQHALNMYRAEETIESIIIDGEHSKLMRLPNAMPGYRIERISYLDSGYIFEYTHSITRGDRCAFKLDLYRNNTPGKNKLDFERLFKAE